MNAKPFIKWAGGKGQLLPTIRDNYPNELGDEVIKYCEAFVGGGAVLFDILSSYELKEVMINDINKDLINTYECVKANVEELIILLENIQNEFWPLDDDKRKEYYYEKRDRFNDIKISGDSELNLEKASLFIFLNKTCFNGLFRVNKKGLFNVPVGSYKKPLICDSDNLLAINSLLKNVNIKCGDYKECNDFIDENTFVYIDPPYRPLNKTSSFNSYAKTDFNDKEQIELRDFADIIDNKGAKVLLSNSDPKNSDITDNFFDDIYNNYNISRVNAKRMINSKGSNRGKVSELIISNY